MWQFGVRNDVLTPDLDPERKCMYGRREGHLAIALWYFVL